MAKRLLSRLSRAVLAVFHDPGVQRGAKSLVVLAVIRLLLALGASAELTDLLRQFAG